MTRASASADRCGGAGEWVAETVAITPGMTEITGSGGGGAAHGSYGGTEGAWAAQTIPTSDGITSITSSGGGGAFFFDS